jgi:hypothetical protein
MDDEPALVVDGEEVIIEIMRQMLIQRSELNNLYQTL